MVKKLLQLTTLGLIGTLFIFQAVFAGSTQTIKLTNNTAYTIVGIWQATGCTGFYYGDTGKNINDMCYSQEIAPGATGEHTISDKDNHRINIAVIGTSDMINSGVSGYNSTINSYWNQYNVGKTNTIYAGNAGVTTDWIYDTTSSSDSNGSCARDFNQSTTEEDLTLDSFTITKIDSKTDATGFYEYVRYYAKCTGTL